MAQKDLETLNEEEIKQIEEKTLHAEAKNDKTKSPPLWARFLAIPLYIDGWIIRNNNRKKR